MIAALFLGFFSSLHCLGMCGPIVVAVSGMQNRRGWSAIGSKLIYHSGRILTYAALGALFGLFGQGAAFSGFQKWMTIALGVLIILWTLIPRLETKLLPQSWTHWWRKKASVLMAKKSLKTNFLLGGLNGLLPCGLLLAALAGAASTGHALNGGVFMLLFGLGTIPALVTAGMFGNALSRIQTNWLRKLAPAAAIAMGCFLIFRGLNVHSMHMM